MGGRRAHRGAAAHRGRGRRHRRLDAGADAGQGATPLLPPVVRLARRAARRPGRRRRAHHQPERRPRRARPRAAIAAGKHVVCEKPLGVDAAETAELVARAADAGVVNAVCFNLRYYPHNQHAAALVGAGAIGEPRFDQRPATCRTGCCSTPTGTGASTPPARAACGPSPTSARTGSTSCSSSAASASSRCSPTCTRSSPSATTRPARWRRSPPPASTTTSPRVREQMESDDAAGLLLRFDGGARGVCTISQVSAGRTNRLAWEIDGDESALAWASDDPEHLWIGHRGRPNEIVEKDPALLTPGGRGGGGVPRRTRRGLPRHVPRPVRRRVRATSPPARPSTRPTYPTFADGHDIVARVRGDRGVGAAAGRGPRSIER